MDQLIRETDPPHGLRASPVPQVWDPSANGGAGGWVRVHGEHNAPRAILYGPNGQPMFTDANPGKVTLTGSFSSLTTAPVVGVKTVSTTAAEVFAGASRLAGRYAMSVYNESDNVVYWGPSGVTVTTGFPILPGDSIVWSFNPDVATSIFLRANVSSSVRVVELK